MCLLRFVGSDALYRSTGWKPRDRTGRPGAAKGPDAREGRKYGIGLMLVSQRPADVESTVISQCGTWLVLRLTNAADQQHVSRFLPDGLSGMTKALPNLAQQEAIFVGEGAAMPARIRIRDLTANIEQPPTKLFSIYITF